MHFVHSLNEGGIERLLLELCRKTDRNRFEIQICCLNERGSIADEFTAEGIKLHFVNAKRDFSVTNVFQNISILFSIAGILRKERTDITHGHEFYSTVFSRISSVLAGVKKRYITLHNVYFWWGNGIHLLHKILSYITTAVICNSKATLEYSFMHDRISREKYILIYNGIDCSRFFPDKSKSEIIINEYSLDKNCKILMTVGSISFRKGFELLIEAFGKVSDEYKDLVLIIAGGIHYKEEEYFRKINKQISDLNLKGRVIITGSRNDISDILNSADIFIMPSVAEGFGLALAEAMAEEKICITSDIDPFKEILDGGEDGFMFKSGNAISLEEAIRKVLNSGEEDLNKIRNKARQKIIYKFSSERMVKEYEKLYSR